MLSARAFYFICFILFYVAVLVYPNSLYFELSHFDFNGFWFLTLHILSIYLFLTAATNPGFVDETETAHTRREKAKLFVGQYDEFKGVDDDIEK